MPDLQRRRLIELALAAPMIGMALRNAAYATPTRSTVVRTDAGKVRGLIEDGVAVFRGIRYGSDTGPRRFMPPMRPEPWHDVVETVDYGPASPQTGTMETTSEDCLFLNVWTPEAREGGSRPVMVYIHGGAYAHGSGSSPLYDGGHLCAHGDVVVVSLNHRLNAFGYAYFDRFDLPELADSGNCGQLDLVLALQWIRRNIASFGGNPDRVMLFGQSGGGAKIATLMAMPAAAGLFHLAATMSGQQVTASGPLNATARTRTWLAALGLPPQRAAELRTMPVERLVEGMRATDPVIGKGGIYFGPVLDERTLTRHPFYPDASPVSAHVPMILGNTRGETRSLIGRSDPSTFDLTWDALPERLVGEMRIDIRPENAIAEYRRLYPELSPSDVFFALTTASRSWRGAIIEAEARCAQPAPTYAYQLDWGSPADGGKWGACHGLDIPLVFGNLDADGSLTGTGEAARAVSRQMSDAFLAFARTGSPDHPGLPRWEPYRLERRATMVFDVESKLTDDPRGAERRLFAKVPFIQQGT